MKDLQGMIRRNYELSRELTPVNEAIYNAMVCYLRTSPVDEYTVEEIIGEILELFLSTQARGEKIEQAIGDDYRGYCDKLIATALKQPRGVKWQRHLANLEMLLNTLILLWFIDLVFQHLPRMVHYKKLLLSYQVNAGFLVSALIIILAAIFATKYIGKNSFKLSTNKSIRKKTGLISGFAIGTIFALLVLISGELSSYVLFTTKLYYIAAAFAAIILIVKAMQSINNMKS
ncbi:DUF1048 domain-containing protein [Desulfotomaculum defluvii]